MPRMTSPVEEGGQEEGGKGKASWQEDCPLRLRGRDRLRQEDGDRRQGMIGVEKGLQENQNLRDEKNTFKRTECWNNL